MVASLEKPSSKRETLEKAFALVSLFHYAGPRVWKVAALQISDVQVCARRGLLIIGRGKGLKHREVPLIQEAREPLTPYFLHRQHLAERWRERAMVLNQTFLKTIRQQFMVENFLF